MNIRLKDNKVLTDKAYEQSVGFLRINDGDNPLDNTGIHPESYEITNKLLIILKYVSGYGSFQRR